MQNPILMQINNQRSNAATQPQMNPQVIQQVKTLMSQMKVASNPQQAMNQMLLNNSQLKPVIDLVKQNNGNWQQAFYNLAKQKGIDPQFVLNQLR